jgi:hypothetical protein
MKKFAIDYMQRVGRNTKIKKPVLLRLASSEFIKSIAFLNFVFFAYS